ISQAEDQDTILFDPSLSGTLALTSGELVLNQNLTIQGLGANVITIDSSGASRIFDVSGGATDAISGLTLTNGSAGSQDGGDIIVNTGGTLTVTNCTISNGQGYFGGGILNGGTLTATGSTFTGNSGGGVGGGGIFFNGTATTVTNCTFTSNSAATYG